MSVLITSMPTKLRNHGDEVVSMNTAPNTAIYLLASVLKQENIDVVVLDPCFLKSSASIDELSLKLEKFIAEIDIICFSSNTINWAMTRIAIELVRKIKGDKIKIIIGGLHPTYFYEHIIENYDVDYIILGAGEIELPKLINSIISGYGTEKVNGIISKGSCEKEIKSNKIDYDVYKQLPLPAFDYLPNDTYAMLPIEASRGCKFNCSFCSVPHKKDWIEFNKEHVIERCTDIINRYQSKFQTNQIFITDDCFTADLNRASYIMNNLFLLNSESRFLIETRATDWLKKIDNDIIKTFQCDQVGRLAIGVECGYDEGLKRIRKGLTIEKLENAIEFFDQNNLIRKTFFSFIIGFPWETMDECIKTIDYAASIIKRFGPGLVNVNWLYLYPSELWFKREDYGIEVNQSIYDDLEFGLDKYFFETHPNISYSSLQYISSIITDYEDQGIYLRNG